MKWFLKLWKAYMLGADANNFPIWKYGFLGEKIKRKSNKDNKHEH